MNFKKFAFIHEGFHSNLFGWSHDFLFVFTFQYRTLKLKGRHNVMIPDELKDLWNGHLFYFPITLLFAGRPIEGGRDLRQIELMKLILRQVSGSVRSVSRKDREDRSIIGRDLVSMTLGHPRGHGMGIHDRSLLVGLAVWFGMLGKGGCHRFVEKLGGFHRHRRVVLDNQLRNVMNLLFRHGRQWPNRVGGTLAASNHHVDLVSLPVLGRDLPRWFSWNGIMMRIARFAFVDETVVINKVHHVDLPFFFLRQFPFRLAIFLHPSCCSTCQIDMWLQILQGDSFLLLFFLHEKIPIVAQAQTTSLLVVLVHLHLSRRRRRRWRWILLLLLLFLLLVWVRSFPLLFRCFLWLRVQPQQSTAMRQPRPHDGKSIRQPNHHGARHHGSQ
mmetsp:Transcript_31699/g.72817  ORF Transcript_31699/g.72817 Transcript_31699/m.72817 type:complete len:385 (+) Transcript_31699:743-1897(+)